MRLPIFSLSLLLSLDLFAATELLRTIKPSGQGGDYTSMSAWEAAIQKDLTASDEFAVAEIDGDWSGGADTTAVIIDGWTTDATRYIEVRTTTAARHTGKWDATKYILSPANAGSISNEENYTRLVGLQIYNPSTAVASRCIFVNSATNVRIEKCIVKGNAARVDTNLGIGIQANAATSVIINCASYDHVSDSAFTAAFYSSNAATFSNCTAYNARKGFNSAGNNQVAKNCLAQSCTDGFTGTFGAASTNNASDIASDAPGTSPQTGTITFTDAANGDFGLVSGVAIGNGADLSGTFTDDLAGVTRTVPWDIGARKYVAAGGGMVLLPTGLLQ